MKKLIAEAAAAAAVAVLTLTATLPAPDAEPHASVEPPSTTILLSSTSGLVHDAEVAPSESIKVVGKLPRKYARSRAQLSIGSTGHWRRLATSRVSGKARFVLRTTAPSAPGSYGYKVTAKAGSTKVSRPFTIRVAAPPRPTATPTSVIITPTANPTATITPTAAPTAQPTTEPTADPEPVPTPGPPGGLGDPNDWTYVHYTEPRWDPCTVITWSVAGPAPYAGHVTDLTNAFALMAEKTGFTFTQVETPGASTFDVTWSTEAQWPALAGSVLGLGGPASIVRTETAGAKTIAGQVILDAAETLAPGYASTQSTWGKVMVHEIGHAIGLGHAVGNEQIMFPVISERWELGAGDLSGLRALGSSRGCFPYEPPEPEYPGLGEDKQRGVLVR